MSIGDLLRRITSALDHAQIPHMLTGSFASTYFGAIRSTQDIDILIEAREDQIHVLMQNLAAANFYSPLDAALSACQSNSMFNVLDHTTGWKIDFILRKNRPFSREEFARRRLATLENVPVFVATAEDVIISKLEWSKLGQSYRQMEDAAKVFKSQQRTLDKSYVEKWTHDLGLEQQWNECQSLANSP